MHIKGPEIFKIIIEGSNGLISYSYFFLNVQFFAEKGEKTVEREFFIV